MVNSVLYPLIRLNELIAAKEKELSKIMHYKQSIYQDWKDGEITHKDYRHMNEDYERQIETINGVIRNLYEEKAELENGIDTGNPLLATFRKHENIEKLSREVLIELVDHIRVYENGNISVSLKFANEYRRAEESVRCDTRSSAVSSGRVSRGGLFS